MFNFLNFHHLLVYQYCQHFLACFRLHHSHIIRSHSDQKFYLRAISVIAIHSGQFLETEII